MVKMYIDTDQLRLFKKPISMYQLSKKLGIVYSNAHRITHQLWNRGFIKIADTRKSKKNPNMVVNYFSISELGYKILELIEPISPNREYTDTKPFADQ